ncbi:HmuY family protein [Bacteroidia bacterium]|nr:HmuY family protein [Bacteroidia bacterium]
MSYLQKINYLSILLLAACFPKEDAVELTPRINKSVMLDAGEYKNTVAFYSLDKAEVVAEASAMDWDFYIDEELIRLNYFRSMQVAKFDQSWDKLEDTVGLDFRNLTYDSYESMSQWELAEDQIYVVDYGLDNEFNPIGLTSVRFERTATGIKIWQNAIGSDYETFEEVNEASFYYNIREKSTLDLPKETEYDIAFGKYTDLVTIDNITQDYVIYGAIQGKALAYYENEPFDSVKTEQFNAIRLMNNKDVLGWDWKNYNRPKDAYEIVDNRTYLIMSNVGFKYKLRFVNFYNTAGQSGHPTFEWELL